MNLAILDAQEASGLPNYENRTTILLIVVPGCSGKNNFDNGKKYSAETTQEEAEVPNGPCVYEKID